MTAIMVAGGRAPTAQRSARLAGGEALANPA
jgi:hypothetical protein